jgi:Mn-dependent DtxR family transcriptional regulator
LGAQNQKSVFSEEAAVSRFTELQRRLAALAEIASDNTVTQRSLASRLDVSLGLANALLRGLESDGLVKAGAPRALVLRSEGSLLRRAAKESSHRAPYTAHSGYAITRAGRGAMQRMSRVFAAEAAALLRKSLGSKAKAARLLSVRRPPEAQRGR